MPSTLTFAYSGQPCPDPSVTCPLTVTLGTAVSATFSVVVVFAVTVADSVRVAYPKDETTTW